MTLHFDDYDRPQDSDTYKLDILDDDVIKTVGVYESNSSSSYTKIAWKYPILITFHTKTAKLISPLIGLAVGLK